MGHHPKIDALDLRTQEGRLRAALQALASRIPSFTNFSIAWKKSQEWMDWDDISWWGE